MKMKLFTITVFILLLTSCGFHLRQHHTINPDLNPTYLSSHKPYSEFTLILEERLQQNGATMAETKKDANSHIRIVASHLEHSINTRGPSNQSQNYNFRFTVVFNVFDKSDERIITRKSVSASESLSLRPNQLLTTNNQQAELKRKLYRRVADLLIMKLQS